MSVANYRTVNVDAYDPDAPQNFDLTTLAPSVTPVPNTEVQNTANQIRQLLRGGDGEGALRSALEMAPYGADHQGKASSITPPRINRRCRPEGHDTCKTNDAGKDALDLLETQYLSRFCQRLGPCQWPFS